MDADVIIIGVGFSGAAAGYVLSKQGFTVLGIDRRDPFPEVFRAEKLESQQADALGRMGMLDLRRPLSSPLGKTINYLNGLRREFDTINQFGINYTDTVNSFRFAFKEKAELVCSRVTDIKLTDTLQTVVTEDSEYQCRLIVLATGGNDGLLNKLGVSRRTHPSLISLSFAFDMHVVNHDYFPFSGFNYFLSDHSSGVDYATIFKIGDKMRVNIFTQWTLKSENAREFKRSPYDSLKRYFPDLIKEIGGYKITSKVQFYPTSFYRLTNVLKPGLVVIGDEYQSVSPTTGSGLDKVTIDVERLCTTYVPEWLKSPGMGADKIKAYYKDPDKRMTDRHSLDKWISYRDMHRGFLGRQLSRVESKVKGLLNLW